MQSHAMKALRFGVAVEVIGVSDSMIAYAIAQANRGHRPAPDRVVDAEGRVWHARHATLVSPILTYADIEMLQTIVRGVRGVGGRAHPQGRIHVHVNGHELGAESLAMLAATIAQNEPGIAVALGIVPPRAVTNVHEANAAQFEYAVQRGWRQARAGNAPDCHQGHDLLRREGTAYRDPVEFHWFRFRTGFLHAGEVKAYIQFALALVAASKAARGDVLAASGPNPDRQPRHAFGAFLRVLGLVGDEFKTARHHLLMRFPAEAAPAELLALASGTEPAADAIADH